MFSMRERTIDVVRRRVEGYVPFEFDLCPSLKKEFFERTGRSDYRTYFGMPLRWVSAGPERRDIDFGQYFSRPEDLTEIDAWGIGRKKGGFEHFEQMFPPMGSFTSLAEFEAFPYPDADEHFDWDATAREIEQIQSSDLVAVAQMNITIFEIAWYLRGMETFMIDLMIRPELAEYHMDRLTAIRRTCARRYVEAGADILHLGDDVATQRGMMISPDMWRRCLKPRLASVIQSAREADAGIIIDYHSDGDITEIVEDLVEIGVDELNPLQPECMDPYEIKRRYGGRLSLRGGVGTQTTMPFATPDEVETVCRSLIAELGRGGGFVLAPTHVLEPEVPWENIEAMCRVVAEHNESTGGTVSRRE